jgi:hypothetical protein
VGGREQAMLRKDARIGQQSRAPAVPSGEPDRSMVLAHRAVALIKALKLPATPRIYEFCYAYATGDYPSLNLVINDLLTRRIAVGDAAIKQIGAKYIPQSDNDERIDNVGMRVKQVINEVLGALGTIIGAEGTFSTDLAQTEDKLAVIKNRQALVDEIKDMMQSASRVGDEQRKLEERLNTSIERPARAASENPQRQCDRSDYRPAQSAGIRASPRKSDGRSGGSQRLGLPGAVRHRRFQEIQ